MRQLTDDDKVIMLVYNIDGNAYKMEPQDVRTAAPFANPMMVRFRYAWAQDLALEPASQLYRCREQKAPRVQYNLEDSYSSH